MATDRHQRQETRLQGEHEPHLQPDPGFPDARGVELPDPEPGVGVRIPKRTREGQERVENCGSLLGIEGAHVSLVATQRRMTWRRTASASAR